MNKNKFRDIPPRLKPPIEQLKIGTIKQTIKLNSILIDNIDEFKDMDKIANINDYRQYVQQSGFWANTWAIPIIESKLNIKIVILSEREFNDGEMENVLQCGDFEYSTDRPQCNICKLTHSELEYIKSNNDPNSIRLLERTLRSHNKIPLNVNNVNNNSGNKTNYYEILLDSYKNLPEEHSFKDPLNSNKPYIPNGYVIVTHNGNHYELVSHKNNKFFRQEQLPNKLLTMIKSKCSKTGLYRRIKGIGL